MGKEGESGGAEAGLLGCCQLLFPASPDTGPISMLGLLSFSGDVIGMEVTVEATRAMESSPMEKCRKRKTLGRNSGRTC